MKRILLLLSLIFCSFSLLFSQSPTLPLDALCSQDGSDYAITPGGGQAYIYQRRDNQWQLMQTLSLADADPLAGPLGFRESLFKDTNNLLSIGGFGAVLRISGDFVFASLGISGFSSQSGSGSIAGAYDIVQTYVYKRNGQTWSVVNQLLGGEQIEVAGNHVLLLSKDVFSPGLANINIDAIIYELDANGQTTFTQNLYPFFFNDTNGTGFGFPDFSIHLSPSEDLAVVSVSGDPTFIGSTPIRVYERGPANWFQETSILPVGSDPSIFSFPFEVNYVEQSSVVLSNGDTYVKQNPGNWILGSLPQANLSLDGSRAFMPKLSLPVHTDEDEFILYRRIGGGSFQAIATLCRNTRTYTDTIMVFGQNVDYYCESVYNKFPSFTNPSDTVTYSLPAIIQPLQLNYVCYDPASDSLTWSVFNPNTQDHPFIYAQWWNTQRDTLYAQAGATVTFKTKNNPQNPGTFGDDNITGIWWIDQTLTPGQPNDIVFNIPLSQSCAGLRMANTSPAQKAGGIFEGTLGNYLKVNVEAQDLLTGQVQIAPNPVSERLTIRGLQLEGEGSVQITNTLGQVVFEQSVELQKEISLNLQTLPVGTYLMTLKTPVGIVSEKILKK